MAVAVQGMVIQMVVPFPSSVLMLMEPPICWVSSLQMGSPSPVPPEPPVANRS